MFMAWSVCAYRVLPRVSVPARALWSGLKRAVFSGYSFFHYGVPYGVRNLIRWFPLIWADRNWDEVYLFRILEFKLRIMNRTFSRYDRHVGSERTARQLLVCAELCRRIHEDQYQENLSGPVTLQHWTTPTENPGLAQLHIEMYQNGNQVPKDQIRRWHEMAERNIRNDLAYLSTLIRKHSRGWWY